MSPTSNEDWRYSDERMDVRTQGLNILFKFGSELCSDGSPDIQTSIYECVHDWVSWVMRPQVVLWHITRHIMGIRLPEPKNGAGLIPFILSLLFGLPSSLLGIIVVTYLITVLKMRTTTDIYAMMLEFFDTTPTRNDSICIISPRQLILWCAIVYFIPLIDEAIHSTHL